MKQNDVHFIKKLLLGLGAVFIVAGVVRQWPVLGKSYMEFISGNGYMALMLGLILLVLGFSARLLMSPEED